MLQTGETLVTDGEQRASSFATYPIIDTLGGKGLAGNLAADGQYFVSVSLVLSSLKMGLTVMACIIFTRTDANAAPTNRLGDL